MKCGSHGSFPRWVLGTEEGESAVVKGGSGSEKWLPGDFCPEHA